MRILAGKAAEKRVCELEQRGATDLRRVEKLVAAVVSAVRKKGDSALRKYAEKWDGLKRNQPIKISAAEMEKAWKTVPEDFKRALEVASGNIRRYCEWQKPVPWTKATNHGIEVGQVVRPLTSAGCYVPGGRYPLPSTMLMTVIPAQVAGVRHHHHHHTANVSAAASNS